MSAPPTSTLFPYTTLFRSLQLVAVLEPVGLDPAAVDVGAVQRAEVVEIEVAAAAHHERVVARDGHRSEEHTSELQSRRDLVCRLLLEKKKYKFAYRPITRY